MTRQDWKRESAAVLLGAFCSLAACLFWAALFTYPQLRQEDGGTAVLGALPFFALAASLLSAAKTCLGSRRPFLSGLLTLLLYSGCLSLLSLALPHPRDLLPHFSPWIPLMMLSGMYFLFVLIHLLRNRKFDPPTAALSPDTANGRVFTMRNILFLFGGTTFLCAPTILFLSLVMARVPGLTLNPGLEINVFLLRHQSDHALALTKYFILSLPALWISHFCLQLFQIKVRVLPQPVSPSAPPSSLLPLIVTRPVEIISFLPTGFWTKKNKPL